MKIEDFANTNPEFKLMEFFEGNVKAWGIVEDRFGNIRRQFKVDMKGTIENDILTLEEDFVYADGEIDKRTFNFRKSSVRGSYKNPYLRNGDIIYVGKGLLDGSSEVITEISSPFLNIFTSIGLYKALIN